MPTKRLLYEKAHSIPAAHNDAINCMVFSPSGDRLATGGSDGKLAIWSTLSGQMEHAFRAEEPICSLKWLNTPNQLLIAGTGDGSLITVELRENVNPNCVIAAYLYHGITCWKWDLDPTKAKVQWSIHLGKCGYAALSPDHQLLGICNNASGAFFLYETDSQVFKCRLQSPTEVITHVLPIVFVHEGMAVITGSMAGKVRLWDYEAHKVWYTLRHSEEKIIQALTAFCDEASDKFLIATGSSESGGANSIVIWEAKSTDIKSWTLITIRDAIISHWSLAARFLLLAKSNIPCHLSKVTAAMESSRMHPLQIPVQTPTDVFVAGGVGAADLELATTTAARTVCTIELLSEQSAGMTRASSTLLSRWAPPPSPSIGIRPSSPIIDHRRPSSTIVAHRRPSSSALSSAAIALRMPRA
ncbi:WD40-repeat-containing domain protein [Earliella scabrosa]|nr:WD40-repeat-containing domain protein [Earliella scabrosa]